jgi:hypothetical protein
MRLAFKRSPYLTESPGGGAKLCSAFPSPSSLGCLKRHAEKAEMPPVSHPGAFPCVCLGHDESVSKAPRHRAVNER